MGTEGNAAGYQISMLCMGIDGRDGWLSLNVCFGGEGLNGVYRRNGVR